MKRKRLKALIEEIKVDESRYDQESYTRGLPSRWSSFSVEPKVKLTKETVINCGTTGCIAGLASFRWAPVGTKFWDGELELPGESPNRWKKYHKFGRKMLGLTKKEAHYLFAGGRSWEAIIAFSDMNKTQRNELLDID